VPDLWELASCVQPAFEELAKAVASSAGAGAGARVATA
jgi:hypothetical protein